MTLPNSREIGEILPMAIYGNEKEDKVLACWKVAGKGKQAGKIFYVLDIILAEQIEEENWGFVLNRPHENISTSIADRDAFLVAWLQSVIIG